MAGSIDRITKEIAAVEQAVQSIARDFRATYEEYLAALGQTVYQQLILASYRLCTQGYPDRFLQLSLQQRLQLQQALRELGRSAQAQLLAPFQVPEAAAESEPIAPEPFNELEAELDPESEDEDEPIDFDRPMSPERLGRWQESLEQNIAGVMRSTSNATNRAFQEAEVLPQKLPEPVLEAAAKAGMMTEAASNMPNLLNLLVETEDEEAKVTHIIAIRLRLAEIEFGDPILANWRSKIRSLLARLNQMEREYEKKQRERAVAEAEAAWRSTWFE